MAYRLNTDEEDQDESGLGGQDTANTTYTASGAVSDNTGTGGITGSTVAPAQKSSGTFQNLMGFLNANKTGGDKLATGVDTNIKNDINEANTAVTSANTGFKSDVDKGTVNYDQGIVDTTLANPTGDTTQFENMLKDYSGPTSLQNTDYYDPLVKEVGDVTADYDLGQTSSGRSQLLSRMFTDPSQNVSQNFKYDQLLLTKAPTWDNVLNTINTAKGYDTTIDDTTNAANALVNPAQTTSTDTKTKALTAAQGATTNLRDALIAKAQQARTDEATTQEALKTTLNDYLKGSGDLTDAQLASLGLTREQAVDLQQMNKRAILSGMEGITGDNYTQFVQGAPTASDVASADEIARYQALARLSGDQNPLPSGGYFGSGKFNYDQANSALQQQIAAIPPPATTPTPNPGGGLLTNDQAQQLATSVGETLLTVGGSSLTAAALDSLGSLFNSLGGLGTGLGIVAMLYGGYELAQSTGSNLTQWGIDLMRGVMQSISPLKAAVQGPTTWGDAGAYRDASGNLVVYDAPEGMIGSLVSDGILVPTGKGISERYQNYYSGYEAYVKEMTDLYNAYDAGNAHGSKLQAWARANDELDARWDATKAANGWDKISVYDLGYDINPLYASDRWTGGKTVLEMLQGISASLPAANTTTSQIPAEPTRESSV